VDYSGYSGSLTLKPAPSRIPGSAAPRRKAAKPKAAPKRKKRRASADPYRSAQRTPKPRKAAKVTRSSNGKRVPPKGGLDLAAIARQWRAAGKPGTWQGYIKANPIRKK